MAACDVESEARGPTVLQRRKNDALYRAISFSKTALLVNIIYFAWRISAILRWSSTASRGQIAAYVAFFVIEWTFAGKAW